MAVAGIVAEYNVFHRGHAWQLRELRRRLGPDTAVVVCMSGNFVQRGDFAIAPKHARAEMALAGGADLVLELPTPWSTAGAEQFARGGAAVLAATGVVTHLAFGCECGDLEPLQRVAAHVDSGLYHTEVRRFLKLGMTFAAARQAALSGPALAGAAAACLARPNNALAVEYLRSLAALGSTIAPMALPRVGADHDSQAPGEYLSASAVRSRLLAGDSWRFAVPESTAAVLAREMAAGRAPVSVLACERAVLSRRRHSPSMTAAARGCTAAFTGPSTRRPPWRRSCTGPRPGAIPLPVCGGCCCTAIWTSGRLERARRPRISGYWGPAWRAAPC